jgi:hypothetical protein
VLVAQGTYYENLQMKSSTALIGECGASTTILDGSDRAEVILCDGIGSGAIIQGFTITNGRAQHYPGTGGPIGGGITCLLGSSPMIRDCEIRDNYSMIRGGGLGCHHSSPSVENCLFISNEAYETGGGVECDGSSPTIASCVFRDNTAGYGGGLACLTYSNATIHNCTFVGNAASAWGGGMFFWRSSSTVSDCLLYGNSAGEAGGAMWIGAQDEAQWPTINGCTVALNTCSAGQGGGLYIRGGGGTVQFERLIVARNDGSGIHNQESQPTVMLTCSDIWSNIGGDYTGHVATQTGVNGNISSDPKFCDHQSDNFALCDNSPCVPGNHPDGADCGLIGALGTGCGPTPVQQTSWGRLKALFR